MQTQGSCLQFGNCLRVNTSTQTQHMYRQELINSWYQGKDATDAPLCSLVLWLLSQLLKHIYCTYTMQQNLLRSLLMLYAQLRVPCYSLLPNLTHSPSSPLPTSFPTSPLSLSPPTIHPPVD